MESALEIIADFGVVAAVLIAWWDTRKRLDRCQAELHETHADIRKMLRAA